MNIYKFNNWLRESIEGKKNFYILIGPPAVGKSSWIKKELGDKATVISKDDIIEDVIFPKYNLANKDIFTNIEGYEVGDEHPQKKKLGKVITRKRFSSSQNKEVEEKIFDIAYQAGKELNSIYEHKMQEAISSGEDNIVVDAIHNKASTRKHALDAIRNNSEYKIIGVVFPFEGYKKQIQQSANDRAKAFFELYGPEFDRSVSPEDYERLYSEFQYPSKSEGFDEIVEYNRFNQKDSEVFNGDSIEENFREWLNEARLSKYWKRRMEARSKKAHRESKNKIDRDWAQLQQEKSRKMNSKIHKIFQNEMEVTDELKEEIESFLERIEQKRQERLKKIKEAELIPLNKKRPKKKLPPLPNNATIGKTTGVVDAYNKKRRKAKGPVAAQGEQFASLQENMDLFNKLSDVQKENFHKLIGDVEEYDILKLRLGKKTKNILTQFNLQIEDVIELLQKCPSLQQPISRVLTAGTKGFIYLLKNDHVLKLFQEDYSGGSDLSWYAYNKSRMFQSDGNVTELAIFDPAHIKLSSGEFVNYVEMARVDPLSDFIENTGRSADSAENDYERCKELLMDLDAKYGKKYYSLDVDKFESVFINYMQKSRVKLETLTKQEFINLAKTVFLFEKAGNTLHDSHVGNIGKLPQSSPENPIFVIFDN